MALRAGDLFSVIVACESICTLHKLFVVEDHMALRAGDLFSVGTDNQIGVQRVDCSMCRRAYKDYL
jgi:hypothetical protein